MPLDRLHSSADSVWGLWRIAEDESALASEVPGDVISLAITNPLKRLEFFAGRALIRALLREWNISYKGVEKDEHGKPFLSNSDIHISLSHSYPYAAAVLHRTKNVGIDLEQPKPKLLRIAPRVLSPGELVDAGEDATKHCVYWCAKEALIKIYGKKDLILSKNLLISPFSLQQKGHLVGRIVAAHTETAIPLQYLVAPNFVVVISN
jgi:4'-phosphopantetheinyl transferase